MLPQIVCLSCGYQRTWPTLLEALADGQRHHAEHPPEPALPESLERRCPYCKSVRIAPRGAHHRSRREDHVGTPVRGLRAGVRDRRQAARVRRNTCIERRRQQDAGRKAAVHGSHPRY
jgi:hypothetical protein